MQQGILPFNCMFQEDLPPAFFLLFFFFLIFPCCLQFIFTSSCVGRERKSAADPYLLSECHS